MPQLEKPLSTKTVVALAVVAGGLLSLAFSLASYEPYLAKLGPVRGGRERSVHGRDATRPTEPAAARAVRPADPAERTVIAELNSAERPVSAARPHALADLVVLISVDGLRPDVLFPHAPNIRLMQSEGTSAVSARTISK